VVESQFEQDSQISTDSPLVLVKAAEKTSAIQQLLDYPPEITSTFYETRTLPQVRLLYHF